MDQELTEITERLDEIEQLLAMAQKRIAEARVLLNFEETPNPLTVSSQAKWAKAYEERLISTAWPNAHLPGWWRGQTTSP